ncbi:metallophosphoesterase [Pyxidicoccus fallax]|uniref:Metallophosphoesterase n=1 Tax=Pyxidicoccus fallax TaxID=394095 RepID=A0A848LHT4_9BACT|nr:metallophosphoesterase [Pyxidicoccus fallax]NMO17191.1 metallophosphoesterase [Pyxidicoccus fallax]NPC80475.1 metallophosphoesterase [Pyxidicoccus fallax]
MKLYAISDLHLRHTDNRQALQALPAHPDDWLIVAGDVGETLAEMELMLRTLTERFRQVIWVPGNHELWTMPSEQPPLRGEARYQRLVSLCRSYGALTPEDPYPRWPGEGPPRILVPMFLGYDYSFRPDHVPENKALEWAWEEDLLCTDEVLLHPEPYLSRSAWCAARVESTLARLQALPPDCSTILINHYPLRYEHVRLPRIPRFSIWCGTKRTEDWHLRFRAEVVVSGHLHMPATLWRDGVRFEEVSLGYPMQWKHRGMSLERGLREILPGPAVRPL